jgi:hypothetical protein
MKNTHQIGWRNVKEFWCNIFSKVLGKTVPRIAHPTPQGMQDVETSNAFAWCLYPKCKHAQDRGGTFLKHFPKNHESKSVQSMGIWALITRRIRDNPEANIWDLLGQRKGYICSKCTHFGLTSRAIIDHIASKHPHCEAHSIECVASPIIKGGNGEGDDPDLKKKVDDIVAAVKTRTGE